MGSPAYDVASLLQDARVTVPDDLELKLLSHYARRAARPIRTSTGDFAQAYAIMAAQRATKVLSGILPASTNATASLTICSTFPV